jgi:immunoglobulin-like protein involved in spore germination/sporulation and spore germination protein
VKPKHLIVILSVVLVAMLGFLAASCGTGEGAESAGPVPTEEPELGTTSGSAPATTVDEGSTTETVPPPDANKESQGTVTYQVWFTKDDGLSLHVVKRTQAATRRVGTAALEALLEGPESFEAQTGVGTAVPAGTQLLGLEIEDGIAFVDLTSEFESGGGSHSMFLRLAQVVCTLDQFPTVKGVLFKLDGEPVDVFSGEGILLDHPVGCGDYEDFLPVILVTSPTRAERVGNPVTIQGSANVFEANVTVRILDKDGDEIARTFTTATCGTGCRGDFSVAVKYKVDHEQSGTIVVQDDDAAGTGTPPHQVRIPVILTPSA